MKFANKKSLMVYGAVAGLLIFLHYTHILYPIESIVIKTFNPILDNMYYSGTKIKVSFNRQKDKRDFLNIIDDLRGNNQRLLVENAGLKELRDENIQLRNLLSFTEERNIDYLLADIISRNSRFSDDEYGNTVILNKGEDSGIYPGLAIVNDEGVLIGKILDAKKDISRACLIIDKNCNFAVSTQNSSKTSGVVHGELGLTIKMELIPQIEELTLGDTVVTSGLEDNVPRGLLVGRIDAISKESNELWQEATINPIVNFDDITIVSVVIPYLYEYEN